TSPWRTSWLEPVTRVPLRRTKPASANAEASLRVRTMRACQSHLSMRCLFKGLELAHDLVRKPVPTFRDDAHQDSLVLCSSCCLSAASLAKGELGSACLLRFSEPP